MSKITDITAAAVRELLGTASLSKAVLAINAAAAATVKTTGALVYTINGVQYTKAALAAQSIAVTNTRDGLTTGGGYVQPANTTVFYALSVDAAGLIYVTQGSYLGQDQSQLNMGTTAVGAGGVPNVPAYTTPFGVIKVATGATTFTPGTTALDAALVTATYYDVMFLSAL